MKKASTPSSRSLEVGGLSKLWYQESGKENGDYYSILGPYWDNGRENGNYYIAYRSILG